LSLAETDSIEMVLIGDNIEPMCVRLSECA